MSSDPGTAITSFTSADLSGSLVQFVDDGNEVAPTFDVTVNDGVLDSNTLSATINYTPVNDAPVLTGDLSATVDEGASYTLLAADLGYVDVDDAATGVTFTVGGFVNGTVQISVV